MKQVEINREWKPIEGYEGIYDLRDDGLIYSHPRNGTKGGYSYGRENMEGYLYFVLTKNKKQDSRRINRLVWETFVGPIPKGYDIHHKNHNRQDNRIENLCLLSVFEHTKEHLEEKSKAVLQYTLDWKLVAEYKSTREAERQTGIPNQEIGRCCRNYSWTDKNGYTHTTKSAGGFIWKYKEVA